MKKIENLVVAEGDEVEGDGAGAEGLGEQPDVREVEAERLLEQLHALQDLGVGDEVAVAGGHLRLERVRRRLRPDGQQVHRVLVLPQRSRQHFRARF